ncbi:hypothetical protein [Fontibacillus phaseoli]|uniref:hypothetical protein n=1 Tax=Fontibacillus phaseoli TaxID=1416533 RepID=UPI0015F0C433|nr:hypothetical protein [Fontibacillus phaseoli]
MTRKTRPKAASSDMRSADEAAFELWRCDTGRLLPPRDLAASSPPGARGALRC